MDNETGVEQALQRDVDFVPAQSERHRHAFAAEEGGTTPIGSERQQHHRRHSVRTDFGEPAFVKQLSLQPAEGTLWPPFEIGPRRQRRRSPIHDDLCFLVRSFRSFAVRSARSSASLWR